ncbi:MAG: RES domain-containing protein [Pontiellaceae bacterium]|nr:RES domain-containing protein [Pontiellaceae bacterium]
MSENPMMPSPPEVLSAIEDWRSLDLRKECRDVIQREFNRIFCHIIQWASSKEIKGGAKYYRVREHHKTWENTSELWEPPKDIAPKGRCNFSGKPMLYVSPYGRTCFEELNVERGKQVYIIKYQKKLEIPVNLRRLYASEAEPKDLSGKPVHTGDDLIAFQVLREFIRSEFMKPVCKKCEGMDYVYNFTESICNFMAMEQKDLDGFVYPSVAKQGGENVTFFPERAREKLDPVDVRIVKLISEDEWYSDPRVDEADWKPILRGKTHFLRGCFKGSIAGDQISWVPCSDLGAF